MNRRDAAKLLGAVPLFVTTPAALKALQQGREAVVQLRLCLAYRAARGR
ncbi:MAG TPA: hypothetical protein VGI83_05765 [Gemmatimonadales bacterium]